MGGLVYYFQVASSRAVCNINDSTCYLFNKKKKKKTICPTNSTRENKNTKCYEMICRNKVLNFYNIKKTEKEIGVPSKFA
jgi:hypothetical protein